MKTLTAKTTLLSMLMVFFAVAPVFADANEVVALQNQVSELNGKISTLERQLNSMEGKMGTMGGGGPMVTPQEPGKGLIKVAEDINMGGYVDVQWNNNFRQPATTAARTSSNRGRIFDRNDGSFSVNAAELNFEKAAEEVGSTGFRVDIQYGEDPLTVNADADGNAVDLQQAYVVYNAPLKIFEGNSILPDNVKIKAGRYVTLAGAEVIEAKDNWNMSRSYLFGFAIPFTHTGVRTNFGLFNDFFDTYLGLNNGWDNPIDNNSFKTLESGLGYKPLDKLSVFHSLYWGGENNDAVGGKRWLLTNMAHYDVTDKLAVMGDFTYGHQNAVQNNGANFGSTVASPVVDYVSAAWWGFAGYARYQFTDKWAFAYRGEVFRDDTLFRTALADSLFAQTLTAEYKITEDLIARAELRHDKANDDAIFAPDPATAISHESSQVTIGGQLIYVI